MNGLWFNLATQNGAAEFPRKRGGTTRRFDGCRKIKEKKRKRMEKILTRPRRKSVSSWLIWHFRVRARVCACEVRVFIASKRKLGRREMGILGKLLSSVSLVSIWCLLIVEPGKVQREQDHLGKSPSYCICAFGFRADVTRFHFRSAVTVSCFLTPDEIFWKIDNKVSAWLILNDETRNY